MTDAPTTDTTDGPRGVDVPRVTEWFLAHAPDVAPPLHFELIAGGRSNLTFRVTDTADHAWVLRRPPLGQVLATAHDMSREHRIISALAPTDVPVAPVIGLCTDDDVNGAPFYVMGFVDGLIARNAEASRRLSPESRAQAGRELPVVDEVHDALAARIPEQGPATIVHGDYRLDNCILGPDGTIKAVLDWELCTLGDPLADVGLLLVYWNERGDARSALMEASTSLDGFPTRAELIGMYAAASGRDVSSVEYYRAFGYWKLACILEGVYARYKGGVMGDASGFEGFAVQVEMLARQAQAAIEGLPAS
jgi:aminoglycoside phosphotransferase (APT) family kinase protein